MTSEPLIKTREIILRPTHLAIDIQGNFYRGLMSGVLLGFILGAFMAYASIAIVIRLVGHL